MGQRQQSPYRHSGGTSAISQTRRRNPSGREIAGQARNDVKAQDCDQNKNEYHG